MIDIKSAVINLNGFSTEEAENIRNCLMTLYSVREGEQPFDREFGINDSFLDQPVHIAKNMLALEIIEKTKKYEKRVSVEKVEYGHGVEGQLFPIISCERSGVL